MGEHVLPRYVRSDETREKLRQSRLGKRASPETIAKVLASRNSLSSQHLRSQISGGAARHGYAYIYRIVREVDDRTIWIGATVDPIKRCRPSHNAGVGEGVVRFDILAEVPLEAEDAIEQAYISIYRELGEPLKNKSTGGAPATGLQNSEETRRKKGVAFRGQRPDKAIAASIVARLGKPLSAETRAKLSAANKGRTWTPQMRIAFEEARKRRAERAGKNA